MAGQQRDVKLNLAVGVTGEEEVQGLRDELHKLAKTGSDPGMAQLADALGANDAALRKLRDAERGLASDVSASRAALQAQRDAFARTRIETDAATRNTSEFKAQEQAARLAIHDGAVALRDKQAALKAAAAETSKAATAQKELAAQARAAVKSSNDAATGVERMGNAAGGAADMLRRLGPLMAGAFSAQQFIDTITAQESLTRGFAQVFGSAERAAQEMAQVSAQANRLGLEVQPLQKQFLSLAASTKGTALEGQATREVFEAVARAMSTLGRSSAETDRALVAIQQIASKGTASMEELRGQLGEALPGALDAAAKGAGITTQQLIEMVSNGQVLASDILPALTKGLNNLYANGAPPSTITGEWARLKNQITSTMTVIGEGGASKGIAKGLQWATLGVEGLSHAFDVAGTATGEFVAKLVTGNHELGTAAELNAKYDAALRKSAEAAGLVAKSQTDAAAATQAQVRAVDNATASTETQVESMLAVRARYTELIKGAADYTTLVQKQAAARAAESQSLVQLVGVYGTEVERRQAVTAAAQQQATAARELARARDVESVAAQSFAIRLQEEAQRRGDNSEATRKELQAAQQAADAKRAEAEQSAASARTKGIEAEAANAAAAAYADNSQRVYELRGAAQAAADEVTRLTAAQREGKATTEEVAAAQAKAAGALALYRDALRDAADAADRQVQAEQRRARLAMGAVSVDRQAADAAADVAEASGDAAAASQARQASRLLEAQAARTAADGARNEAQALRESADARERELGATGQLTPAKQAEIEATRDAAEAKELEARSADILANKIVNLAKAEKKRQEQQEQNKTADGFAKNKDGSAAGTFTNLTPFDKLFELQQRGVGNLTADDADLVKAAQQQSDRGRDWINGMIRSGGAGSVSPEALRSMQANQRLTANATRRIQELTAQKAEPGSTHTVNINLPDGTGGRVRMVSEDDAKQLTGLLSQLSRRS